MNAHAFRSDDLAAACRLTVEQEEERRARRKKWTDRERRFTEWWQNEYGTAFLIKWVGGFLLVIYVVVIYACCMEKRADANRAADKLACLRACKIHKPIIGADLVPNSNVCLCYRQDGGVEIAEHLVGYACSAAAAGIPRGVEKAMKAR